jgi:hypothetical protein
MSTTDNELLNFHNFRLTVGVAFWSVPDGISQPPATNCGIADMQR